LTVISCSVSVLIRDVATANAAAVTTTTAFTGVVITVVCLELIFLL